jgi:hypothetical protein
MIAHTGGTERKDEKKLETIIAEGARKKVEMGAISLEEIIR